MLTRVLTQVDTRVPAKVGFVWVVIPYKGSHPSVHVSAHAGAHASVHEVVWSYVTWSVFTCSVPYPLLNECSSRTRIWLTWTLQGGIVRNKRIALYSRMICHDLLTFPPPPSPPPPPPPHLVSLSLSLYPSSRFFFCLLLSSAFFLLPVPNELYSVGQNIWARLMLAY